MAGRRSTLRGDDRRFREIVMSRLENVVVTFVGGVDHRKTWKEIFPRELPMGGVRW
jgi:hypothetical protein